MNRLLGLFCAVLFTLTLGCGGDGLSRVVIRGKVVALNGPVGQAAVSFIPKEGTKGEGGIGTTDNDGNFTLIGSRLNDAGVVPGKYKVVVSRYMEKDGRVIPSNEYKEADNPLAIQSVPAPFSTIDSTLEVTVAESGGALQVEIPAKLLEKGK
ncbi:MAG: carboxypeptidase regulatory-like domain-containing protein [Gemmataceae bacterium]|nr:carboxypeptidase regulatory-like domain-containing protein [Gemmataceae bacterium]